MKHAPITAGIALEEAFSFLMQEGGMPFKKALVICNSHTKLHCKCYNPNLQVSRSKARPGRDKCMEHNDFPVSAVRLSLQTLILFPKPRDDQQESKHTEVTFHVRSLMRCHRWKELDWHELASSNIIVIKLLLSNDISSDLGWAGNLKDSSVQSQPWDGVLR